VFGFLSRTKYRPIDKEKVEFSSLQVFFTNKNNSSQLQPIKHITRKVARIAAGASNFFEAVFLVQLHGAGHGVKGFEVAECIPQRLCCLQAFC
jgi:hypothetical protein